MSADRGLCAQCRNAFDRRDPVMFEVRVVIFGGREFCGDACALTWARAEVVRLGGWLRAISTRYRGLAADLAGNALNNELMTVEDYLGGRKE